ncbi:hypothetical protein CG403_05560, partial [Gardnerella vaginalis]
RKVRWTLRLSGSALRIAFARYTLSAKTGLAPAFVSILLKNGTNTGKIGLGNRDYLVVYLFTK